MTKITLRNQVTGEEKIFINSTPQYKAPWKVVHIEHTVAPGDPGEKLTQESKRRDAQIAVWAEKFGLPVSDFFDIARWLLKKDCPFCQLGTQVLKAIGELGEVRATQILSGILDAKKDHDLVKLEKIRDELKKIWSSEQSASPRPS